MAIETAEAGRIRPSPDLVGRLVSAQFPQWADLAVTPVEPNGWDNTTYRLGQAMSVRLPTAERYVPQVEKEHRWLPRLSDALPLPIPAPLALGRPGEGYPWPWSICRWIEGQPAASAPVEEGAAFAADLAAFLRALQAIDAREGPAAGDHNFHRGGRLAVYDAETRRSIEALADGVDAARFTDVWDRALASCWQGAPVWVHGDMAPGNLLVKNGRLAAVIDFGSCGVGDPACDLVIAWTFLEADSRRRFKQAMALDRQSWERARGWALWKALITAVGKRDAEPDTAAAALRIAEQAAGDDDLDHQAG